MKDEIIEFKCIEISQPIGVFYVGSVDASDVLEISFSDIRRLKEEKRAVEKYLGIERPLSPGRVAEIKKYVNVVDATFPTSIILAVSSENAEYDETISKMRIKKSKNVAKIIDGQHRIAGLHGFLGKKFQLNVTFFIDMDIEDQAMVFSTINLKHTKVNKSLVYDLYEYAKARSPQKTCHNIAKLLNTEQKSPFKGKIKILGLATGSNEETLTQATFVNRLIIYITKNALGDRDALKRGKSLKKITEEESKKLIFGNMFIEKKDAEIAKIIWNFFSSVQNRWPNAWNKNVKGNLLNRTTGFCAMMRFLGFLYNKLGKIDEIITISEFSQIFSTIDINEDDFNPERYKPGSSGEGDLYRDLCSYIQK